MLLLIKTNRVLICHQKIKVINNNWDGKSPVIFAVSHIGRYDYQIVSEVLKVHQIPFSGDPDEMKGTLDGFCLWLNGVLYCDTENKDDRKKALQSAIDIVRDGNNFLIYPEGIWNLSSNSPILPLFPGVIKISMETGRSIVPVAIEQYGKRFVVNIGEKFETQKPQQDIDAYINRKRQELREKMVALKWEIYESLTISSRAQIGNFNEYYQYFRKQRLNEWCDKKGNPFYNDAIIQMRTYREI